MTPEVDLVTLVLFTASSHIEIVASGLFIDDEEFPVDWFSILGMVSRNVLMLDLAAKMCQQFECSVVGLYSLPLTVEG